MALSAFVLCVGCKNEPSIEIPTFDGQRAFAEVEALVQFSPRDAGTENGRKAAEHILDRLEGLGIQAEIDTFKDATPVGEKTFNNVIGQIPGKTGKWILLGSHFDTMPGIENFQGANDSGSSTGVLLELARLLADTKPDVGIRFAFFDGEEGIASYAPGDGLHGSRHMVKQLVDSGAVGNIDAMILLDMVGDKDLNLMVPYNSDRMLAKKLFKAAYITGHREYLSLSTQAYITDDHVPFLEAGVPAIDIIDFRFGSKPGLNDHWHTEADNLENIDTKSLQITGEIAMELLQSLAYPQNTE